MRLDESFQNQCFTFSKVPCASSYGHFIARKEFWSQCHILRWYRLQVVNNRWFLPKMIPNGDQQMPKTSQMAIKLDPKWSQNRGWFSYAELVHTIFVFFEILGPFWEPFWSQFGAKSLEKHIQKCVRKSAPKKYRKSWKRVPKTMPKCDQMLVQNQCKIGMCDFSVFYESIK